jgi:hypothetical protein
MISWKLRRVPAAEEAVIRQQAQTARGNQLGTDSYLAGPMPDPTAGQILAGDVSHRCSELAHLQMYEMRLDRALHACLRQLRQLKKMQQDQREESEQNEQNEQNEPTDDESARVTPSPSPRTRGEGWGEGLCGDEPGQAVLNPLRQDPSPALSPSTGRGESARHGATTRSCKTNPSRPRRRSSRLNASIACGKCLLELVLRMGADRD